MSASCFEVCCVRSPTRTNVRVYATHDVVLVGNVECMHTRTYLCIYVRTCLVSKTLLKSFRHRVSVVFRDDDRNREKKIFLNKYFLVLRLALAFVSVLGFSLVSHAHESQIVQQITYEGVRKVQKIR